MDTWRGFAGLWRGGDRAAPGGLMSYLPNPDVPPGPLRELLGELHHLHHRAGWPSLRVLARRAGCSHTTVAKVFSSARPPSWGLLEVLVRAMKGDVEAFHQLWLEAATADVARASPGAIAGRR